MAGLDQQPSKNAIAWDYIQRVNNRFQSIEGAKNKESAFSALDSAQKVAISRRRSMKFMSFAALAGLSSWLSYRYTPLGDSFQNALADFSSDLGEVKALRLADKSQVWLNTNSAINVDFSRRARLLTLVRGEVLIDTASGDGPNFKVKTEHGMLRALGTRFSVSTLAGQSRLAVYEGAVELVCSESGQTTVVDAGRQIDFDALRFSQPVAADKAREAWSEGRLVADQITLKDFIAEVERYHPHIILLSDQVKNIPVIGSFPANDLPTILAMLEESLEINVNQTLPWLVQIKPATKKS